MTGYWKSSISGLNGLSGVSDVVDKNESIQYSIPIRTVSALNMREHWAKRAKRVKAERNAAYLLTPHVSLPAAITMTRLGPRRLDDDNLRGALKGVRDGIADRLGVDDGGELVEWRYGQGKAKDYAVVVEIREAGA